MRDVIFARCTYTKLDSRRLLTTVEQENNELYVYKAASSIQSEPYLSQLIVNGEKTRNYIGNQADISVGELMPDGRVRYPFIPLPTVQYCICECIQKGNFSDAYRFVDNVVNWIYKLDVVEANPQSNDSLSELYGDDINLLGSSTVCLKLGLIDINAENLLLDQKNSRYSIIDHEIVVDGHVPLELVVFRFTFFTLLRIQHMLNIQADITPLRAVNGGLLYVPKEWNISSWIDEKRISTMITLEERLQSYYTGHRRDWPRHPVSSVQATSQRQVNNVAVRLPEIEDKLINLQQSFSEQQAILEATTREYKAYRYELEATVGRFDEYIEASKGAIADYQSELVNSQRISYEYFRDVELAKEEVRSYQEILSSQMASQAKTEEESRKAFSLVRYFQRNLALKSQQSSVKEIQLEGELNKAYQKVQLIEQNERDRAFQSMNTAIQKVISKVRSKFQHPIPKLKRRLKNAAKMVFKPRTVSSRELTINVDAVNIPYLSISAGEGFAWQGFLVSIVLCVDDISSEQEHLIIDVLSKQTFQAFEVVYWSAKAKKASLSRDFAGSWHASSLTELAPTLLGKFAMIATPLISEIHATYIEENIITLESEELDFVINSFDNFRSTQVAIEDECFPIQSSFIIGRTEMVNDKFWFDFDLLPQRTQDAHVAGRIIQHYSDQNVFPTTFWQKQNSLTKWNLKLHNSHIFFQPSTRADWNIVHQTIYPVDTVLPTANLDKKKPRLLVLFPFLAVGGAEKLTLDVIKYLLDSFDVIVATVEPLSETMGSMVQEYRHITPYVYTLPAFLPNQLNFSAIVYLLEKFQVDTLFVANGAGWIYDAAGSIRSQFPSLYMVNQVYDHRVGWIDRYDSALVQAFDRHIAPNKSIVEAYLRRGVEHEQISLIYHGVEMSAFDPDDYGSARLDELRLSFGLNPNKPVVGFLARMHPQKRPLDFISLAQRFGQEEATFFMVGDGSLKSYIDQEVQRLRIPHLVTIPFHTPFVEALAVCNIVCILSEYEGLPLVLLNAQAMDKPVVATDVGAIREVLEYTGGGRIVSKIGDVADVERAIRDLLGEKLDMTDVRKRVSDRFGIESVSSRYVDALKRV